MIVGRTLLPLPNPQRLLRENVHANVKGRKRTRQPKRCLFGRDNNDKEVVNKIIEMKISSFLLLACSLAVCPKSLTWKYLSHRQFANEISLTQFIQNLFVLGHLMDITRKVTVLIWDTVSSSSLLPFLSKIAGSSFNLISYWAVYRLGKDTVLLACSMSSNISTIF